MKLTEHFSLEEFESSDTAKKHGIDNSVPGTLISNVRGTAMMMEAIRQFLSRKAGRDIAVHINSGYRCEALNRLVGGQKNSDHLQGCAADFVAPGFGDPFSIAKSLENNLELLGIGQLIKESTWVHVSPRPRANAIDRVLTIDKAGIHVGIVR